MVQTVLARIPLIISFPTIILSGNLIVPTYQDILELHLAHTHDNDHINQAHFLLGDTIIRIVFLPLFLSQIFAFIGCAAHIISKRWNAVLPIVLTALVVSQLNFILDPIQTTVFTAVTIKQLINSETRQIKNTSFRSQLIQFIITYTPLFALSLVINCTNDKTKDLVSYIFDKDSWYYLPFHILLYVVLIGALRYIYPFFKYHFLDDCESVSKGRNHQTTQESSNTVLPILFLGSFASLAIIFFLNFFYSSSDIQLLMIFVFSGCVTIFYFSLKDSLIENYQRQVDPTIENAPISTLEIPKYVILLVGLMAVTLQYLSFNTVASSVTNDFLTIVFVVISEAVARLSTSETASRLTSGASIDRNEKKEPITIIELPHQERSVLKQIVLNKDTRSIFSFLLLNTTFMLVQLLYSFRSKSLGLLSDSLHMALDCMSLFLGLLASVLSKRPAGDKFPFRLKYLETLAGFTNGILLLGIVCGVFVEALGRLFSGAHIEETNELLVVAILGLLVNLVGLISFDHTGGHGHGDGASNGDNMKGIFLHILADTLGSVGVVLSTILIKLTNLHIFDSIASIMIASLILVSTLPLLKSTTQSLLMKLDDRKHSNVKNALNQITTTPGITGYTTPRFWPAQPNSSGHSHSHGGSTVSEHESSNHEHEHEHEHEHSHSHVNKHEDKYNHIHGRSHQHDSNTDHTHIGKHQHAVMSKNIDNCSMVGYIHVQYNEGENSTIIKKRVEKILEDVGIHAWVQVEPQNSNCWCRATSMSSVTNPNTANPRQNGILLSH